MRLSVVVGWPLATSRRRGERPIARVAGSLAVLLPAVVAGIAVASLAGTWLAFPIHVTSNSMAPYLRAGDYGVAVFTREIRRGDVIAFRLPFGSDELAIKRAVALADECVPAGGDRSGDDPPVPACTACPTVPPGAVYVIGDNVANSLDSRHFGAVPASEIVGKVVLRVPVKRWLASWREPIGSS